MPIDPRTPCIIGVGRRTWHPADDPATEPLAMWAEVARDAARDARTGVRGRRRDVLRQVDAVHVVHCTSWTYDDAPKRLAEELGTPARHLQTSIFAGTASQRMVNAAAERMLAGGSELALVAGGEALHTLRRLRAAGAEPPWSHRSPFADEPPIDLDEWFWPTEWGHDVIRPTLTFAVLDSARRAHRGTPPDAHLREEAEVLSRSSAVAAANPRGLVPPPPDGGRADAGHRGQPDRALALHQDALAVVDLADGRRAYARCEEAGLLDALGEGEWVGRAVHLTPTRPDRATFTA